MGATCVTVTIRNPAEPSRSWEGLFLVATGATDSLVPRRHLEAIGLAPKGQRVYETADGREVKLDVTTGDIEFMGDFTAGRIIMADDDAEPLLGVTALESAGIEVETLTEMQNLVARVTTTAGAYLRDQAASELKSRLREIFEPTDGWCYQQVAALPAVDDVDVGAGKVTLVVSEPHPDGLHPDLVKLYEQLTYRNRVCFLTGERAFDSLLDRARELRAINQIITEMHQEGVADGDPQMQQARDQLLPRFLAQFHSAIRESFTTLHYPTRDRLARVDFLMEFRENRYDGEQQVVAALAGKQKYTEDLAGETFRRKVEARLFTQQSMLWSEVVRRAATQSGWQWHRSDALDRLKQESVHQDRWREEGQYVNKGPFPKPATTVRIQELSRDDDTGNVKLRVSPVHGDRLYSDAGAPATPASKDLGGGGIFQTNAMLRVSFLAVDSTGGHEPGEPVEWTNRITLESREYVDGGERRMEIRAAPPAPIRYTTDGSHPKLGGGAYDGPFPVPDGVRLVLTVAEKDGIASEVHQREVTDKPRDEPIDATAPAVWRRQGGFSWRTTSAAYPFINRLKQYAVAAGGLRSGRPGRLPVGGTQLLRRHRAGGRRHRTAGRTGAGTPAGGRGRGGSALRAVRHRPAIPRLDRRQQGIVRARRGGAVTMAAQATLRSGSTGFGFRPDESEHHFVVTVPAGNREEVTVAEHLRFDPEVGHGPPSMGIGPADAKLRAVLPRAKWNAIADEVRVEFNRRLRKEGLPAGRWRTGANPLARLLGKELALLAWAVEDADPTLVPAAIRNWLGLAPEERWWLFTMTAAATGHALHGRGRGWRKAVRYALTENPVGAAAVPREIPSDTFRLIAPEAHRARTPGRRRAAARRSPAGAGKGGR